MSKARKETGHAWLGTIPAHWHLAPLGSVFKERKTMVSDVDFEPLSVSMAGVVPRMENVALTINGDARKLVRAGDYVINSRSDRKGSSGLASIDGSVSVISTVLRPRGIEPRYAHHLLRSSAFQEEFYRWGSGIVADLWSTRYQAMSKITLPLPPLAEQQAIADFLDRETAKIDALIEKQNQLVERLRARRQLTIDHAIPENPMAQLRRDLAYLTSGSRGWAEYYSDEGDTFIRIGNLDRGRYSLKMDDIQYVNLPGQVEGARSVTHPGDLLFSITAYLGSVAVVPAELAGSYVSQHVALARLQGHLWLPEFVAYAVISTRGQEQLSEQGYGGTKIQLSLGDVREVLVPVISKAEQQGIVDHLDRATAKIDTLIAKAERFVELARERRSALITAAVTGQLDITERQAS